MLLPQVHGGSMQGPASAAVFTHMLTLWPQGLVSQDDLSNACKRASASGGADKPSKPAAEDRCPRSGFMPVATGLLGLSNLGAAIIVMH